MYPHCNCRPVKYLFDHFDSDIPWHCYWDVVAADASHPANVGSAWQAKKLRSPDWSNVASKLVFPTYTPSAGGSRARMLVLKVNTLPPPFTFQLAFRFSEITNHPTLGYPQLQIESSQWFEQISTGGSNKAYSLNFNTVGLSGGVTAFANNSFAPDQAVYLKFQIDADRTCRYEFKVNGAVPTRVSGWDPATTKTATTSFASQISTFYPDYITIRFDTVYGGKLDYLEVKVHDHTA